MSDYLGHPISEQVRMSMMCEAMAMQDAVNKLLRRISISHVSVTSAMLADDFALITEVEGACRTLTHELEELRMAARHGEETDG